MKKFNFLSVLVVALFTFLGNNIQAQQYMPSSKAALVVVDEVEALSARNPIQLTTTVSPVVSAELVITQIKIDVGNELIPLLKEGIDVNSALNSVISKFQTNDSSLNAKVSEADLHYRNLLK